MIRRPFARVYLACALVIVTLPACGPRATARADVERERVRTEPTATPADKGTPKPARTETTLQKEYRAIALENRCPEGYSTVQGGWRFIGETKAADFSDELSVKGTRFTEKIAGRGDDGKPLTAALTGEIRCLFNNRILVMVDTVVPAGAFGNTAGDAYPCDVLGDVSGRGERMLLVCYSDWDMRTSAGLEFEYERTAR